MIQMAEFILVPIFKSLAFVIRTRCFELSLLLDLGRQQILAPVCPAHWADLYTPLSKLSVKFLSFFSKLCIMDGCVLKAIISFHSS